MNSSTGATGVPYLAAGMQVLPCEHQTPLYAQALCEELDDFLRQYLEMADALPLVVALCGAKGSGRSFLFTQLACQMGCDLLLLEHLHTLRTEDILLAIKLYGAVACVSSSEAPEEIERLAKSVGVVFVVCEELPAFMRGSTAYFCLAREIPALSAENCEAILRDNLGDIPFEADIFSDIWQRRLSAGQLLMLAYTLRVSHLLCGAPVDRQSVACALREHSPLHVEGGQLLSGKGGLGDIVLPEELHRQLRELCAFARLRDRIYRDWGFGDKIPWGRGVSALFYGMPGTGKTLAAVLLANEVGLPLLRVDLSQITSKYIGDTQKNIGRIFDDAATADCILFFDEADAIFARRSETNDAQDKYANAETAYLLQRMEQYDGVCILATNLLQNFDEAFRRRIGYMLHFPLPDAAMRERIWRGVFPTAAPLGALDYQQLARQLELSGASIKNCAVHAAYLAAMNSDEISMQYIVAGAKNEYAKQGKTLSPQLLQVLSV